MKTSKFFIRLTKENKTSNGIYTYDFEYIYETLTFKYSKVAMVIEFGKETKKEHCHILLQNSNVIRFETLKKLMPFGKIEKQRGKASETLAYMQKDNAVKASCDLSEFEDADIQGKRTDLEAMYTDIAEGKKTVDIIADKPSLALQADKIERVRQIVLAETYRKKLRLELKENVIYVQGESGIGKTRFIFETFGFDNVYRVTDYKHPFDSYNGESVLVFEEFRSQITIGEMLNLLDVYPLMLPSRYTNKVACYTTVFIVSNWTIDEQFKTAQEKYKSTFKAFLRRISLYRVYTAYGIYNEYKSYDEFKTLTL